MTAIHWRPAGWQLLACGAPHVSGFLSFWDPCCTTDPGRVTCHDCVSAAGHALGTCPDPAAVPGAGMPSSAAGAASASTSGAPGITGTECAAPECMSTGACDYPGHRCVLPVVLRLGGKRPGLYVGDRKVGFLI